jgi:hypothetical protein
MRVYTTETPGFFANKYAAVVQQDHQYFTIAEGDKDHCDFIAKMFVVALSHHDAALAQLEESSPCKRGVAGSNPAGGSTSWGQSVTSLYPSEQLGKLVRRGPYVYDKTNPCNGTSVGCTLTHEVCDQHWQEKKRKWKEEMLNRGHHA